ncbi:TPA: phage tail tape measure protein [Klebsiella pneumoniae]|nr:MULTISPECIES: phage tail tape measure protein [Klebsiella]MBZ7531108.1 phage tail tape measure protein [Klebsiella variicola]SBZ28783.1 phage tail length tape-measure protein 1 [Klebsiella pneumoniae]HBR2941610.1 phage tail tape measure protein [Klebsiella pneumoniae]HBR4430775.1 phage tail tape measure protein [Klebsiella pneumoniae]HEB5414218.1 phage tail tape measure protein [Klebsiella pneumoniae]
MATLRELIIKISANSQSFQTEIARASRMGQDYYRTMQNGSRQSAAAQRETQRALASVTAQLNETRSAAIGMTGAFAGAFATANLIKLADSYNSLSARVKLATTDANDFSLAQKGLMDISQRTGSAFADNSSLFTRASSSLREWGYGTQDILKLTDALANGLQVSGASAEETSSLIVQLSQALGRGVLRGQDFNSVAQSGQRIMKALADGMGVAQKDLKAMADTGQLTTDRIVPALISQLDKLRAEFNAMPNSVSAASTRIQNAFMEWVGGANQASGATASISSAMDSVAGHIDTVATAAGAMVAVGVARYFGNWTSSIASNTGELIKNYQLQVSNAAAQLNAAQMTQRKAAANAEAAVSAYNLAKAEANVAKGTNASVLTTQNLIQKRKEMIAANAGLIQSNGAVAASEAQITRLTSATNALGRGFSFISSLVGGWSGAIMLGGLAWYYLYQKQEQARQSAIQYADTIDAVRESLNKMSSVQIGSNLGSAQLSLTEQNRAIDEQENKLQKLRRANEAAQATVENAKNGLMVFTDVNAHAARTSAELAIEEGKLEQMINKRNATQKLITDLTVESINKTVEMTGAVSSLADMYDRLNRVTRQTTLLKPPSFAGMVLPALDDKQQSAVTKMERNRISSGLKGPELARQQAQWDIEDYKLPAGWAQRYMSDAMTAFEQNEANKPKRKGQKSEAEKTEDVYNRLKKQQEEQIALAGQNNELAKVKYQVVQGELSSLDQAKKEILLQNAALIDQKNIAEQLKTYREGLADSNAAARDRGNIDFLGAGAGDKARDRMKEMADIRTDFLKQQRDLQRDFSRGEISEDLYKQQTEALKTALDERLTIQEDYYKKVDEQQSDWRAGISDSLMNYVDQANDLSSMAASATSEILNNTTNSISNNLTSVLTGATSFKDGMSNIFSSLGETVIKTLIQMATQALITKAIMASFGGGAGGLFGSLFGGASGAASSGTAIQSAGANFSFNALGGVYDSPSLSAYSNGVYSTPQYFAFAKGAGVFGEAGPEAIMPLTRGADGSLGVRAVGRESPAVQNAASQIQAQPRIAVSVDARSTFTGKPDDITMQAVERRNNALEQRIVNSLTAEIDNPQKKFGRAIYSNLQSKKPR